MLSCIQILFVTNADGNPRTESVRIAAELEGVSVDYVQVDVANKSKEFTDAFPTGLVSCRFLRVSKWRHVLKADHAIAISANDYSNRCQLLKTMASRLLRPSP